MGYHDLSECTLSDDERWQEKNQIVSILEGELLSDKDREFVDRMKRSTFVSVKQLFWLRDIKDKFL